MDGGTAMTSPEQHRLMDRELGAYTPPPAIAEIDAECVRIEDEFCGWHAWCDLDGTWHARLADGGPKDRVSAPDPVELRKRIAEYVS
jgi:hypothetical protein